MQVALLRHPILTASVGRSQLTQFVVSSASFSFYRSGRSGQGLRGPSSQAGSWDTGVSSLLLVRLKMITWAACSPNSQRGFLSCLVSSWASSLLDKQAASISTQRTRYLHNPQMSTCIDLIIIIDRNWESYCSPSTEHNAVLEPSSIS